MAASHDSQFLLLGSVDSDGSLNKCGGIVKEITPLHKDILDEITPLHKDILDEITPLQKGTIRGLRKEERMNGEKWAVQLSQEGSRGRPAHSEAPTHK